MFEIFATPTVNDWGETIYMPTVVGYILLILLMVALLMIAAFITTKRKDGMSTKQMVFSSASMAIAFILSNIKLFDAPMGGSITLLSMFFITIIGYWYGLRAGLMTAVAYGILQLLVDPYILSVPQMICDYLFAFGALGLSGLFSSRKNGLVLGYIAGILGRYFFSFLSGLIFFAYYAPETMNPAVYSLLYNGAYIGIEGAITIVLIVIPPVANGLKIVKKMATD